jgi:hypothetical protein
MVFTGWPNGKELVIQGVDLGGSTNVNIRLERVVGQMEILSYLLPPAHRGPLG